MSNIKLFESKQIRSVWNEHEKKWYFSVQDVVEVLTDSADVKQYIKRILSRDEQLKSNWGTICTLVEMMAADGKRRKVQAADAQGLLRIIQSIPSPNFINSGWIKTTVMVKINKIKIMANIEENLIHCHTWN